MYNKRIKQKIINGINEDSVEKYLLLLLNNGDNSPVDGKTKLMKEIFFISKNIPQLEEDSDFEPNNFGPYSEYVSKRLNELINMDIVKKDKFSYKLTPFGQELVKEIDENHEVDDKLISDMKNLFSELNEDESLALVYFTYPETTVESLVKGKIENKREKLALDLLKKRKITSAKAAQIAGMPLRSFYKLLQEKDIKIDLGY